VARATEIEVDRKPRIARPIRVARWVSRRQRSALIDGKVSKTESEDASISRKDILALALSAAALVIALVGAWFQFFRNEAHLKVTVASSHHSIDKNVVSFASLICKRTVTGTA
jgi:hypothetical protein